MAGLDCDGLRGGEGSNKNRLLSQIALVISVLGLMWEPSQAQTFSVLYNFGTNSGDPLNPGTTGATAQGRDGNLYSTAPNVSSII
jgi:hypothetical protein